MAVKTPTPFEFQVSGLTQDGIAAAARVHARIDCQQGTRYRLALDLLPESPKLACSLNFRTAGTNRQNAYRLDLSDTRVRLSRVVAGVSAELASAAWPRPSAGPAQLLLIEDGPALILSDRDSGRLLLRADDSAYSEGQCFFFVTSAGSRVTWGAHGQPT